MTPEQYNQYLASLPAAVRTQLVADVRKERTPTEFFQWYAAQSTQTQQFLQAQGGRNEQVLANLGKTPTPATPPPTPPPATPPPRTPTSTGGGGGSDPNRPIGGNQPASSAVDQRMSEQSARAIIRQYLEPLGLGELENLLYSNVVADQDYSPERLVMEVRKTPQYAARFPGMVARQQQGRNAISEGQYIQLEREYKQLMQSAGLPTGFYDSADDFSKFIGYDISPDELGRRIQQGYQAVAQADPSVRDTMRRFYGVTDGELAAYFLDPSRAESLIAEQAATAQIGAAAARFGFSQSTDRLAAERLQRLGVTEPEATQVFGQLGQMGELLNPIEGGEDMLDVTETALGLTGRSSAEALQRLRTRQRQRTARFEGGGQFATQGAEVVGLQQA